MRLRTVMIASARSKKTIARGQLVTGGLGVIPGVEADPDVAWQRDAVPSVLLERFMPCLGRRVAVLA